MHAAKAYLHTKYWTPSCAPLCFPRDGSSHSTPTHSPGEEEGRGGEGEGSKKEGKREGSREEGRGVEQRKVKVQGKG